MVSFFRKTFGGLDRSYQIRQYIFGGLFAVFMLFMLAQAGVLTAQPYVLWIFLIYIIFYPYARFAYDSIVEFLLGDTVFSFPIVVFFFLKMVVVGVVFSFTILLAPIGLLILYIYHTRNEKKLNSETEQYGGTLTEE